MKRAYAALLASLSLALFPACAEKAVKVGDTNPKSKEVIPLVGTYQVQRYHLANGLRLLVVEDHSSPTFAYQTWFRVGSRDEVPGYTGLAHLFEHLMFKGTTTHKEGEFDHILEASGVEGENAFTSRDYTAYVQELPKDKLELIAQLESDRMVNLVVDENSFKTEREVVQNERRFRTENNPDGTLYQELFGLAFAQHPYHWPVIGYNEDLERMSAADASKFYHSYYSPNHATVLVVGDVTGDQVFDIVQKYYGNISAQESPTHVIAAEPPQTSPRRKTMKLNIQVEKVLMGYHTPEVENPDMAALDVVRTILAGGKSSRLHRALVESGLATSVETYDLDDKDPSLLIISANMQKSRKATQAENVILREIARLSREQVPAAELERAKNQLSFGFFENLTSNLDKAQFLGHYETIARTFEFGLKAYTQSQAVTAADVQMVAKKYLDPKNRSVIVGVSKPATHEPKTEKQGE